MRHAFLLVAVPLAVAPFAVAAQDAVRLPDVAVTGNPLGSDLATMVAPASVLSGERLLRLLQPTLGETLGTLPGVASSYFGPNASRPVIRGLDGERVLILRNGLATFDASGASADHAVALDPLAARRIEVLRGPATLLYGPSAIGGVVNVLDDAIPPERADGTTGEVDLRFASPSRERAVAARLDGGSGGLQLHVAGFKRRTDDLRIPGFAWSRALRDERGEDGPEGRLPNSASDSDGYTVGASYAGTRGYAGASWNAFDTDYGTVADEAVTIRLQKRRFDAAGEVREPFAGVATLRVRAGRTDYEHTEFEGDAPGTVFRGDGREARVEARHRPLGPFEGVVGVQATKFDFSADGEEAFLPETSSRLVSVFVYEEARHGPFTFSVGGRYDDARVRAADSDIFGPGASRTFRTGSGSAALAWTFAPGTSLGGTLAYSQRPPNYQELFADGPHVATGAFEVGDRALDVERSLGFDVALRHKGQGWSARVGAFHNRFRDYIALFPTGEVADDLPVYVYRAVDARFQGVEVEGSVALGEAAGGAWSVEAQADWLRATDTTNDAPLPRIAPARFGAALVYASERAEARLDVMRVARADRPAPGERLTDSYTLVDIAVTFRLPGAPVGLVAFVRGTNLLDEEARQHASLLKDIAPLGRRGVSAGVRGTF